MTLCDEIYSNLIFGNIVKFCIVQHIDCNTSIYRKLRFCSTIRNKWPKNFVCWGCRIGEVEGVREKFLRGRFLKNVIGLNGFCGKNFV